MKRENKRSWWVQCIECEQDMHVKITKKEAQEHALTVLKFNSLHFHNHFYVHHLIIIQ